MIERIGITSTIPVEVIYASGRSAIDLNNLFVTSDNPLDRIRSAEEAGFPRTTCSWIKGIYSTALKSGIKKVVAVVQGDCSSTISLSERLKLKGVEIIPFSYPYSSERKSIEFEINKLMDLFGVSGEKVSETKGILDNIRKKVKGIDEKTWKGNKITGFENHIWQISCSDFKGDPYSFDKEADIFLSGLKKRKERAIPELRIGLIGIPPIVSDVYTITEQNSACIVYNEVQRQFAMPYKTTDIVEQYARYTYPYGIANKLKDIRREIKKRRIDALIHYVQSFCHHQIEVEIYKDQLDVPILAVECDSPGKIDGREKTRIEAFLSALRSKKRLCSGKAGVVVDNKRTKMPGSDDRRDVSFGIDIGSRYVKMVSMHKGKIVKGSIIDSADYYRRYSDKHPLGDIGFESGRISATGYGRNNINTKEGIVLSEIEAHVKGVIFLERLNSFTLVDIGGQDVKIVSVKDGQIGEFIINDKCAAGTGRYLENMCVMLGVDMAELSRHYMDPIELNSTCAVFGETELISKIAEGVSREVLCASVNLSAYAKMKPAIKRMRDGSPIVMTGGGAANGAIRNFIMKDFETDVIVPEYHQFAGAVGCALELVRTGKH